MSFRVPVGDVKVGFGDIFLISVYGELKKKVGRNTPVSVNIVEKKGEKTASGHLPAR